MIELYVVVLVVCIYMFEVFDVIDDVVWVMVVVCNVDEWVCVDLCFYLSVLEVGGNELLVLFGVLIDCMFEV